MACRHRRGVQTDLLNLNFGAKLGRVNYATPRPPLSSGKSAGPFAEEASWAPGTVQTGWEKIKSLTPTWVETRTVQPVASHFTDCALLVRVYKSTADMHIFVKSEVLVALTRICRLLPPGMRCPIFG